MPVPIDRDQLQRLVHDNAGQVVEVLPKAEYDWAHLAGAHRWLRDMDRDTVNARLDPSRPVVAYCNDFQCGMSPRAAWRLGRLGFTQVYDYVASKMDWLSFGLPHEGDALLAGDVARREVPTCGPDETLGGVRRRLEQAGSGFCVVVNERQVVLGLVQDQPDETRSPDTEAEQVMDCGITTVRPAEVGPLAERMRQANVAAILLTRSDGTIYGLLAHEADAALARQQD